MESSTKRVCVGNRRTFKLSKRLALCLNKETEHEDVQGVCRREPRSAFAEGKTAIRVRIVDCVRAGCRWTTVQLGGGGPSNAFPSAGGRELPIVTVVSPRAAEDRPAYHAGIGSDHDP
jgi:hypothetical protein